MSVSNSWAKFIACHSSIHLQHRIEHQHLPRGANHRSADLRENNLCHQERSGLGSFAIDSATRWASRGGGLVCAASSRSISSTEANSRAVRSWPVCSTASCFCCCCNFGIFGFMGSGKFLELGNESLAGAVQFAADGVGALLRQRGNLLVA